jgi:hypothetical protein
LASFRAIGEIPPLAVTPAADWEAARTPALLPAPLLPRAAGVVGHRIEEEQEADRVVFDPLAHQPGMSNDSRLYSTNGSF